MQGAAPRRLAGKEPLHRFLVGDERLDVQSVLIGPVLDELRPSEIRWRAKHGRAVLEGVPVSHESLGEPPQLLRREASALAAHIDEDLELVESLGARRDLADQALARLEVDVTVVAGAHEIARGDDLDVGQKRTCMKALTLWVRRSISPRKPLRSSSTLMPIKLNPAPRPMCRVIMYSVETPA